MKDEECNILVNLSREEYREFRSLVIDMVLATDMTCHFQQIKSAKSLLSLPELRYFFRKPISIIWWLAVVVIHEKFKSSIVLLNFV